MQMDTNDDDDTTAQTPNGFEKNFLSSWKGWDQCGDFDLQFYDAVSSVDIGAYGKGTVFGVVTCMMSDHGGIVEFYLNISDKDPVLTRKMQINLVE